MTRSERLRYFGIWLCLGLLPLFLRPLWEPDEARYAEIPREMLALGDWLTPRLNYVLYFEKPPLQYWLSAAAMRVFGEHPFAARLPLALATLISLWCAWRLARRLGARQPIWAAFMAATAVLAYVCGQILTLDALFSAFHLLAFTCAAEAVAGRYAGRGGRAWTLAAFASLALAMLTKGLAAPVLVGMGLLLSLPWAWREPRLRSALLRTLFDPWGWLLFAALAGPWFVLVDRANPGHANFFFLHEHFARFTSHVHSREGSKNPLLDKLYFFGVLGPGLVPWLAAGIVGVRRGVAFLRRPAGPQTDQAALHRWTVAAVLLAAAWPLAFYTLSGSKLPPYILPAVVPILALSCAFEREGEELRALARSGRELLVLGILLVLVVPFLLKDRSGLGWVLATGAAFAGLGCWALRPRGLTGARWMAGLGAVLLLLTVAAQGAAGAGKAVGALVRMAPADAQWISCGNYYQGIAFTSGQRTAVVAGTGELAYGRDHLPMGERERWFQDDAKAFTPLALRLRAENPQRPVWALVDKNTWRDLPDAQRQAWEPRAAAPGCLLVRLRSGA
jgi:4-amino-4-deoxy-L-arabinose transferase-like glycosyltransferase